MNTPRHYTKMSAPIYIIKIFSQKLIDVKNNKEGAETDFIDWDNFFIQLCSWMNLDISMWNGMSTQLSCKEKHETEDKVN